MATSLFDWIMHLMSNPAAREHFQADPQGAMASAGMSSVCAQDVRDAKAFLLDHPDVHPVHEASAQQHAAGGHALAGHAAAGHAVAGNEFAAPEAHGHEQIRYIINNYYMTPGHHPAHVGHTSNHFMQADGTPPTPHVHDNVSHLMAHPLISPRAHDHDHDPARIHEHNSRTDHNHHYQRDDNHQREYGVGPTNGGATGTDQHSSRVAHDQVTLGGRGNLMGDGNDAADRSDHSRFAHIDDHRELDDHREVDNRRTADDHRSNDDHRTNDDHGFRSSVPGNGSSGRDFHDTRTATSVNGNGSAGRDFHDTRTAVPGNGSAGHDIHAERSGAVLGQGVAGGDIDHTGGLAGLDHTVSVGNVNLLSGLVNTGDVLNGSPILSGDLNNSLNHSLNHLNQGSLDDLLHNTDVHDLHNILDNIHVLG